MTEEITACPVSVDDAYHAINLALGQLEVFSEMIRSNAADNRAFPDVAMAIINNAMEDLSRGLQSMVEAFPELAEDD
jgi:hypothetical protein